MALISIKRDVDLQPGLSAPAVFHCSQGDVGTTIMLGLLNGGVEYPITTSTTIQISGSRSTGEVFSSVNATWSGSTVSFNLTAEMTADPGPTLCEAVLTRGTDILGTANFILAVEENPMGNVPPGIFTDAGWLWVLDKLSSEQVAALGDDVIGAINSKADESDVTTALATKVNIAQGAGNSGKVLVINSSGNVVPGDTPIEIDDTLTQAGEAADAKAVGDAISSLSNVPTSVRQAILSLFQSAAYAETGLTDEISVIQSWASVVTAITLDRNTASITRTGTVQLTAITSPSGGVVAWSSSDTSVATVSGSGLITGVGNGTAIITASCGDVSARCTTTVSGFATLTGITAVYTQSGTVYTTDSLDSLKNDLVVTAHFSDSTTQTVTTYTLSGTLTEGTSTIAVAYGGKTTTFTVIVTANTVITGYTSVGTPNISGNEFTPSADGYIKTAEVFSPGDSSWAVRFKLDTVPEATNVYSNIFRVVDNNNNGQKAVFIQDAAGTNKLYMSSNNSSYDVSNAEEITIPTNATIFIEVAFDGINSYTVKTSDDGEQWTIIKTITSSNKVYSGYAIAFGGPNPSGTIPYDGKFYLDTIKIYIDGSLWWQATA